MPKEEIPLTPKAFLDEVRASLRVKAPLDAGFTPAAQFMRMFEARANQEGAVPVALSVERTGGLTTTVKTVCFADEAAWGELNKFYVERWVKALLWAYGGFKIYVGGPAYLGESIKQAYTPNGLRAFDYDFIARVYERQAEVVVTAFDQVPDTKASSNPAGRHLDGCRLGFDAGGSDLKVSAVVDGQAVFSEEVVWLPKVNVDPEYHFKHIVDVMKLGASHMPRVDAVGISSAGVYIDNRTMIASLFIKVPPEDFDAKVKDIYIRAVAELGADIPLEVANDGDVTALAGAMDLDDTGVLGIAMGTSEAGGFVDGQGNITGWLNELAFVPVDYHPEAMVDEWSGDYGCGVKYFSQDAVAKLAPAAGITLDESMTPAEKLKHVQSLETQPGAQDIFRTIGVYLGYGIAYYARLYDVKHVLILGRVTSGEGGPLILDNANKVLAEEYPELAITLHLPDESNRRVGQSIAAASLPMIRA